VPAAARVAAVGESEEPHESNARMAIPLQYSICADDDLTQSPSVMWQKSKPGDNSDSRTITLFWLQSYEYSTIIASITAISYKYSNSVYCTLL
jgi:hypothetical protein